MRKVVALAAIMALLGCVAARAEPSLSEMFRSRGLGYHL
jgi:hypothetical protein